MVITVPLLLQGAFWSTVVSIVIGFSRLIIMWVMPAPLCGSGDTDERWDIIAKVHYLHFAIILATITVILHVSISYMTPPRPKGKVNVPFLFATCPMQIKCLNILRRTPEQYVVSTNPKMGGKSLTMLM